MSRRTCVPTRSSPCNPVIRRAAAAIEGLELRRLLSASSLDTSFNNGSGFLAVDVDGSDSGGAVVVQPWDDKIVVLNNGSLGAQLVRYDEDGSNPTVHDLSADGFGVVVDVAVAPGNKLVVVGDDGGGDIRVARYGSTLGSPEFSNNYDINSGSTDAATGVAVRGNGTIVVGGQAGTDMFVLQLDIAGAATSTTVINFGFSTQAGGIALDPTSGFAVIVGDYNDGTQNFAAARVDDNGILDITFDGDGLLLVNDLGGTETLTAATISSSGDIFAVGTAGGAGVLAHIGSNGAFDGAFGGGGTVNVLGAELAAFDVAFEANNNASNKLLITGLPSSLDFSLSRYTTTGAADATFDGDGNVQTDIGSLAIGFSLAQHGDGRIVVAGMADDDLAVARYGDAPGGNVVTADYDNQTDKLTVTGTTGADAVVVTRNTNGVFVQAGLTTFGPFTFGSTGQISITLGDGDDQLNVASSLTVSLFVDGGAGNDTIKGGGGNDILLGGPGNDRLMGAAGRDLLIGGTGVDRVLGDQDDDIIIGGITTHDANPAALQAIHSEWTSARSYAVRVANLQTGTGSLIRNNGTFFLAVGSTLLDDGAADSLTGNAGSDWFILSGTDVLTDVHSYEFGPTIL